MLARLLPAVLLLLGVMQPAPSACAAAGSGRCTVTSLYYVYTDGRVTAQVRNETEQVVSKVQLRVGWFGPGGEHLGSRNLTVDAMWLEPGTTGTYVWTVRDFLDKDVERVKLEDFRVWFHAS